MKQSTRQAFFTGIKTSTPRFKSNRFWIVVQPVPNVSGIQFIAIYYSKYTSSGKQTKKTRKRLGFSHCALESKTLQKQSIKTLKDSRSLGLIWQQTDSSGQSVFYNSAPMNARLFLSCLLPIQGFW